MHVDIESARYIAYYAIYGLQVAITTEEFTQ